MPVTIPVDVHHSPAQVQVTKQDPHASSAHGKKTVTQVRKTPARTIRTLTIRAGESIYSIARREHSTVAAIVKANPKLNPSRLIPGTQIKVPGPPSAPATKSPQKPASATPKPEYAPKPTHVPTYAGTSAAKGYPAEQVRSGDEHRQQLATKDLPTKSQLQSMITATAQRYGVSSPLALGIAMQESGFQQSAVSICDAIGTMQVMPETGDWAGRLLGKNLDIMQAQDNITAGVTTLRFLTTHAKDQDEAIGGYYQGLGAMQKHGPYEDTKRYIASVKSHMAGFTHE